MRPVGREVVGREAKSIDAALELPNQVFLVAAIVGFAHDLLRRHVVVVGDVEEVAVVLDQDGLALPLLDFLAKDDQPVRARALRRLILDLREFLAQEHQVLPVFPHDEVFLDVRSLAAGRPGHSLCVPLKRRPLAGPQLIGNLHDVWIRGVSEDELDEDFIEFSVLDDGCFRLDLSVDFCNKYYIKVGSETQKKTGFPEYMFQVHGTDGTVTRHFDHTDGLKYLIETDQLIVPRFAAFQDDVTEPIKFDSRFPLDSFDTRISLDVVVTFPMSSQISVFNGKEGREFMLARFPLTDYKQLHSRIDVPTGELSAATTIKEVIQTGLADLTLTNPEMISVFMLPGTIYHANFQLNTRYYSEGKIVSVPTDMENGFWNIELLFSKKKT